MRMIFIERYYDTFKSERTLTYLVCRSSVKFWGTRGGDVSPHFWTWG